MRTKKVYDIRSVRPLRVAIEGGTIQKAELVIAVRGIDTVNDAGIVRYALR